MQIIKLTQTSYQNKYQIRLHNNFIKDKVNEYVKQHASEFKVAGFRPGKAPISIILKEYNPTKRVEDSIINEALSMLQREHGSLRKLSVSDKIVTEDSDETRYDISFLCLPKLDIDELVKEMPNFLKFEYTIPSDELIKIVDSILNDLDTFDIKEKVNENETTDITQTRTLKTNTEVVTLNSLVHYHIKIVHVLTAEDGTTKEEEIKSGANFMNMKYFKYPELTESVALVSLAPAFVDNFTVLPYLETMIGRKTGDVYRLAFKPKPKEAVRLSPKYKELLEKADIYLNLEIKGIRELDSIDLTDVNILNKLEVVDDKEFINSTAIDFLQKLDEQIHSYSNMKGILTKYLDKKISLADATEDEINLLEAFLDAYGPYDLKRAIFYQTIAEKRNLLTVKNFSKLFPNAPQKMLNWYFNIAMSGADADEFGIATMFYEAIASQVEEILSAEVKNLNKYEIVKVNSITQVEPIILEKFGIV